jgi:hypothetical protein
VFSGKKELLVVGLKEFAAKKNQLAVNRQS